MTSSFRIIYRPPGWRTPRQWPTQNFSSKPSVIAWTIKFLNVRKLTCVIIDRYQIHESEKEFVILRRERERDMTRQEELGDLSSTYRLSKYLILYVRLFLSFSVCDFLFSLYFIYKYTFNRNFLVK